jgi:hypothetical protein
MRLKLPLAALSLVTLLLLAACVDTGAPAAGFVSLFNGRDLSGWQYVSGGPGIVALFDGKTASSDARFTVADGILTVHNRDKTDPKQPIRQLYTIPEVSGDFILRLEFRAGVKADSGIFVGPRQLQCRDYSTVGPYLTLKQYKPQDWNQIEMVVHGTTARCTCNGELLEAAMPVPAGSRRLGLEADSGVMEYRHIELKLLP